MKKQRIQIYDTTLRDGAQAEGVWFSLADKVMLAQRLDEIGVDYIEGGYPLSNPKDQAFFKELARSKLKHARLASFGMTRRKGVRASRDAGMKALLGAETEVVTIVGKSWHVHVEKVLRVSRDENLRMISDSVSLMKKHRRHLIYDAEHFFDGYRANAEYALATVKAAAEAGADLICLCDTNGGSLPHDVHDVVCDVISHVDVPFGIHPHNDGELAVANALAAVQAGCVQVQGTINGIGERCGNVDLISVAANLRLKMDYDCLVDTGPQRLTELSRYAYDLANLNRREHQPFVGSSAFAHKGGMHVHAVQRFAHSYEHIRPDKVGNTRKILVSELSGSATIREKARKMRIEDNPALMRKVLHQVQELENQGYQFEAAEASFELLLRKARGTYRPLFELDHYRSVILRVNGGDAVSEATVKVEVGKVIEHRVAEGDGPVDALSGALRKALRAHYPVIEQLHLVDYKVRVVNSGAETAAKVRVIIEFRDGEHLFGTIGVSENVINASWVALVDGFEYTVLRHQGKQQGGKAGRKSPRRSTK